MNDIERTVGDINKVWLAGFRAGVEAAEKLIYQHRSIHGEPGGQAYNNGLAIAANCCRSLLNESGAAEKDEA